MAHKDAILFLTHHWDPVHARRFLRLSRETSALADTFLLVQTRDAATSVREIEHSLGESVVGRVITFHPDHLPGRLGYPYLTPQGIVPGNAHYPLALFARTHEYRHYWLVENDVEFSGSWADLVRPCLNCESDLIASHLRKFSDEPNWFFWPSLASPKRRPLNPHHFTRAFFPVYRITRKAILLIDQLQRSGWRGHCEALIPTILNLHGMSTTDFLDINQFYLGRGQDLPLTQEDVLDLSTLRWRPPVTSAEFSRRFRENVIFHPVKEAWTYKENGIEVVDETGNAEK